MNTRMILSHLSSILLITLVLGLVYVTAQQNYRGNANDPQVQVVSDISNRLNRMAPVEQYFPDDTIDLTQSLGLFVVLYDREGRPLRSSALFKGSAPKLPGGVFDFVKTHGEERVTWQPQRGVRMAMVIRSVNSGSVGFAAAGRSLREVEAREEDLRWMVFVVWMLSIGIIASHGIVENLLAKRKKTKINTN